MLTYGVVEGEGSEGLAWTHAVVHVPPPLILARCKQGDSLGATYSRWRSVQTVVRHTSAGEESEEMQQELQQLQQSCSRCKESGERFEKHGIGVPPPFLLLMRVKRRTNARKCM